MKSIRSFLFMALLVAASLWLAGSATMRSAAADPRPVDPASSAAVTALVSAPADEAVAAVPAGFGAARGYRPVLRDGMLVNPHGDCSSPVPLPSAFTPGCQRHDLGYDLLRHAAAVGRPLPASARRAIDAQLAQTMQAACPAGGATTAEGVRCRAWADVATAAVWMNSWRQGWSVPGRESAASIAEAGGALGSAGAAAVLLVGSVAPTRRRLRSSPRVARGARSAASAAARLADAAPRGSTTTAGALAAYASVFPGFLPRSAVLQGLSTALFLLPTLAVVRRLRPASARCGRRARVLVAVAGAGLLAAGSVWADAQQDAQRAAAGLAPNGLRYWLVALAVVGAALLFTRAAGWVVRNRRRVWRPAVALGAMAALLAPAAPAQAAAPTPGGDHVLTATSPVGAVRAYGAERPGESLPARAVRVADDLVARGGLSKDHVVLMVPTGSGWVDPAAVEGFERRFRGDVALVGLQYAHTPSWVAYLFQRKAAEDGARELERAVTARIDRLPPDRRPQVHLYGESLGALAGQAVLADPTRADGICSALWVGSPGGATAGRGREASVANPSDPVVHATPWLLVRPSESGQPWLPGVSFVQASFDLVGALSVPSGHGHKYGIDQAEHLPTC